MSAWTSKVWLAVLLVLTGCAEELQTREDEPAIEESEVVAKTSRQQPCGHRSVNITLTSSGEYCTCFAKYMGVRGHGPPHFEFSCEALLRGEQTKRTRFFVRCNDQEPATLEKYARFRDAVEAIEVLDRRRFRTNCGEDAARFPIGNGVTED